MNKTKLIFIIFWTGSQITKNFTLPLGRPQATNRPVPEIWITPASPSQPLRLRFIRANSPPPVLFYRPER